MWHTQATLTSKSQQRFLVQLLYQPAAKRKLASLITGKCIPCFAQWGHTFFVCAHLVLLISFWRTCIPAHHWHQCFSSTSHINLHKCKPYWKCVCDDLLISNHSDNDCKLVFKLFLATKTAGFPSRVPPKSCWNSTQSVHKFTLYLSWPGSGNSQSVSWGLLQGDGWTRNKPASVKVSCNGTFKQAGCSRCVAVWQGWQFGAGSCQARINLPVQQQYPLHRQPVHVPEDPESLHERHHRFWTHAKTEAPAVVLQQAVHCTPHGLLAGFQQKPAKGGDCVFCTIVMTTNEDVKSLTSLALVSSHTTKPNDTINQCARTRGQAQMHLQMIKNLGPNKFVQTSAEASVLHTWSSSKRSTVLKAGGSEFEHNFCLIQVCRAVTLPVHVSGPDIAPIQCHWEITSMLRHVWMKSRKLLPISFICSQPLWECTACVHAGRLRHWLSVSTQDFDSRTELTWPTNDLQLLLSSGNRHLSRHRTRWPSAGTSGGSENMDSCLSSCPKPLLQKCVIKWSVFRQFHDSWPWTEMVISWAWPRG